MIETIMLKIKEFPTQAAKNRKKYIRTPEKDFTRDRTLGFIPVAFFINYLLKRSMAVELEDVFYKFFKTPFAQISNFHKSSMSRARAKLKAVFFKNWAIQVWTVFQQVKASSLKKWRGFTLIGVDGTKIYLYNNEELKSYFGTQSNQHGERVMGHAVSYCEILNSFIIGGDVRPYTDGERAIAIKDLPKMPANSLLLYDRLFPSVAFIYAHIHYDFDFVMRAKLTFNNVVKTFVQSGQLEQEVSFSITTKAKKTLKEWGIKVPKKIKKVTIRLLRIELDSGETEVLISTLTNRPSYVLKDFKWLYAQRWGSETTYDQLKNKFKMELMSGRTVNSVKQDIFATWFMFNLQSVFIRTLDPHIEELNQEQERKNKVQINRNVTLGILKIYFIDLFLLPYNVQLIPHILHRFSKHLTDDIKGQNIQKPRPKKTRRILGKHQTYKNYAPAI